MDKEELKQLTKLMNKIFIDMKISKKWNMNTILTSTKSRKREL